MTLLTIKANLIKEKPENVSKHFVPDEIALLSDFLVSLFQRKE